MAADIPKNVWVFLFTYRYITRRDDVIVHFSEICKVPKT